MSPILVSNCTIQIHLLISCQVDNSDAIHETVKAEESKDWAIKEVLGAIVRQKAILNTDF